MRSAERSMELEASLTRTIRRVCTYRHAGTITTISVLILPFAIIASRDRDVVGRTVELRSACYTVGLGRTHGPSHRIPVTTSTSLNLRALLKTALVRSGMDSAAAEVSGLTSAAKAFFVAGAAQAMPRGVVLYIVPSDADIEQAVGDVRFFTSALEGLSEGAVLRSVLPFP